MAGIEVMQDKKQTNKKNNIVGIHSISSGPVITIWGQNKISFYKLTWEVIGNRLVLLSPRNECNYLSSLLCLNSYYSSLAQQPSSLY